MKINPVVFGIITVVIFMGIILGFQAAGVWSVSGKVDGSGNAVNPDPNNVETIKGWMTLSQIAEVYGVTIDEIKTQFNLSDEVGPETAIKDLESDTFETSALRDWLLSRQPGSILVTETPAKLEPTIQPQPVEIGTPVLPVETGTHTPEDMVMTGKTTFQQLLDWGLKQDEIEKILGTTMPDAGMIIKDYLVGQGLEFADMKTAFQAALDNLK